MYRERNENETLFYLGLTYASSHTPLELLCLGFLRDPYYSGSLPISCPEPVSSPSSKINEKIYVRCAKCKTLELRYRMKNNYVILI